MNLGRQLKLTALLVLVVGGVVGAWLAPPLACADVRAWGTTPTVRALGLLAIAAAILCAVPRAAVIAAAGVGFGFGWGAVLAHAGGFLGAVLAFALARGLGQAALHARWSGQRWFATLEALAADPSRGLWAMVLLRINPIMHFTLMSFASGVLPFSLRTYALGTFVGMLPMTLVVSLAGDSVGCALLERRGIPAEDFWAAFGALTAMTVVSVLPPLVERLRGHVD